MSDLVKTTGKGRARSFSSLMDRLREKRREMLPAPIEPGERDPAGVPLSFAQQRLWFLAQLRPESAAYNVSAAVRIEGRLDGPALQQAFNQIVARHEILRTNFEAAGGRPVQVVNPAVAWRLPVVELAYQEPEKEWHRLAVADARRRFYLDRGPLLRTTLLRLEDDLHILLLTLHHLISDGWSMGVLIRELLALYTAAVERQPSPLPDLPVQYADFALWQRERLQGEELEGHLAYWRRQLAGSPPLLQLPADRPRPPTQSFAGARHRLSFPPRLVADLEALARREKATLFVALLAAFLALLTRWSGQEDLVVGTPVANRRRAEVQGLIGFFVNTLAIRCELGGEPGFREILRRTRDAVLEAQSHQELPFEKLVSELQPERNNRYSPLFQVAFAFQNVPMPSLTLPGLTMEVLRIDPGTAMFDLTLDLEEAPGRLDGNLEYSSDLFDATTVARLAEHFANLLTAITATPAGSELPLSALDVLRPEERHQLLWEWNDTDSAYPRATLVRLFAEQAARRRDEIALEAGDETVTYGVLAARAERLARHLLALGVAPEDRVALHLERSIAAVVAILGVLQAGGAYLPLDPSYPRERLAWMLRDSGARLLLTDSSGPPLPESLEGETPVIHLDRLAELPAGATIGPAAGADDPDGIAYVLYTSGSTGTPKGVAATHRAVVRLVRETAYAAFGPDEVFLQFAPLSFDASTLEIWGPLLNGARLVIAPPGTPTLAELAATVRRHRVSTLWLTAGLFHRLVEGPWEELAGVRQLLAGGDVLSPRLVRQALAERPGGGALTLINGYGPTEGTTFSCCQPLADPADAGDPSGPVPIGRPIAGTRAHVLGVGMQPAPIGAPGELCIGGDGLARGYLARPDLTAERFVPDPFAGLAGPGGGRLYRTGDRVRLLPDGRIDFLGRLDGQVKVRGFRIEPGEVEAALARHPAVAAAAVLAATAGGDPAGEKRLVAYLACRREGAGGWRPEVPELRRFLRATLPEHMVPAAFVFLVSLPLTANGKLDRRALPEPDSPRAAASGLPAAARTPLEELLCEIWEEVLEVPRVGGGDNFFDLGGHSLLAMQLASRIRESFAVELPLRDLFEAPTVSAVAARIESLRRREGSRPAPPIRRVARDQAPVLSFAQERLWFFGQVQPDSPIFNMALAVRLQGELAIGALEQSLREVVRRHEVLRTSFPTIDGLPVQRIAALGAISLPVVDLEAVGEGAAAEARRLYLEESRQPFDLAAGPLLRPLLLRLAARRHELLVTLHHIICDGWSLGLLVRELGALYPAFAAGGASPLPDLPFQYLDYAVWQRDRLEGELLENQVSYWRSHLRGAPTVLEVETDRPRPPAQSFRGAIRAFSLDAGLTHDLEALSRASGCTLYMTLLAAFQTLIHAYTGRDDLLVGSPVANRNRLETEGLIGLFVNMLVLRATFADNPTFRLLLARTREATLGAYVHQDLPFDKLVQELRPVRDAGRPPIFQVIFAYQQNPSWDLDLPGLNAEILPPAEVVARYDLHLSMLRQGEGLEGYLTYNADLYDAATAGALLARFAALLREAAAHPDERVDRLAAAAAGSEIDRRNRAMERKSADAAQRERLFSIKRPKGFGAAVPLVRTGPLAAGRRLPWLAEPAVREVDLASWAAGQGELLRRLLEAEGAILFRGFEVESIERFREVATAIAPDLIGYEDPSTPRTEVKEKVYTSTEYPPEQSIQLHNELSYNHAWPMKIFFYCVTPAQGGGETPLADSRRLFERIDPAVRERFAAKGVMYVRNFGEGFGLPWQQVFKTGDKSRVEAYCRERGTTFEWRDRDRLRTRHVRPAVARHPATGEMVWFNQANVHHPSSLPPALRESLLAVVEDRDFPLDMNACFGDGSLIPDADVAAIRRAYDEETTMFPWQQGDLLLADNMLVAHGRSAFEGPRRIVVLMAETMTDAGR